MRDLKFSQRWRFNSRSSGLTHPWDMVLRNVDILQQSTTPTTWIQKYSFTEKRCCIKYIIIFSLCVQNKKSRFNGHRTCPWWVCI